jgi:hypothetical protein
MIKSKFTGVGIQGLSPTKHSPTELYLQCFFETRSHYIAQADLKLKILLPVSQVLRLHVNTTTSSKVQPPEESHLNFSLLPTFPNALQTPDILFLKLIRGFAKGKLGKRSRGRGVEEDD